MRCCPCRREYPGNEKSHGTHRYNGKLGKIHRTQKSVVVERILYVIRYPGGLSAILNCVAFN